MWGIKTLTLIILLCSAGLSQGRKGRQRAAAARAAQPIQPDVYYDAYAYDEEPATVASEEQSYEQSVAAANPPPAPSYEDSYQEEENDDMGVDDVSNSEWDESTDEEGENPTDTVDAGYENPSYPIDEGYGNPAGGQRATWVKIQQPAQPVINGWHPETEGDEEAQEVVPDEAVEDGAQYDTDDVALRVDEDAAELPVSIEADWQADNKEDDYMEERKPWLNDQVELRHAPVPAAPAGDDDLPEENGEDISEDAIEELDSDESDDLDNPVADDAIEYIEPENIEMGYADSSKEHYGDYNSQTSEENSSQSSEEKSSQSREETSSQSREEAEPIYTFSSSEVDEVGDVNEWPGREDGNGDDTAEVQYVNGFAPETPSPQPYEDVSAVASDSDEDGRRRSPFTAWHYTIFAIAGAVFMLAFVVIAAAIIRAVTYQKPIYRRLEEKRVDPARV